MTKAKHLQYLRHNANTRKRNAKANRRSNAKVIIATMLLAVVISAITTVFNLPVYI